MTETAPFDPIRSTQSLLRRARFGALATLEPGSGAPYCSLVNIASAPDGAPVMLISRLARHTRNLLADPRASLLLHEPEAADPLDAPRIMISGRVEQAEGPAIAVLRRRYLALNPAAELFADFEDFSFFVMAMATVHLVAGFGRIVDLDARQVLIETRAAAAFAAFEADAVAHLNDDHRGTLALYAQRLLGAPAGDWQCKGCDPDGLLLDNGNMILRLNFPRRVEGAGELRKILKDLADQARDPR